MNKLAKLAVAVAGLALVTQAAKAANDDIILGFTGNGAANDYVLDLGNAITSVGVNGSSTTDLTSFFNLTTFNATFTAGVNGVMMGAGGGKQGLSADLYITELQGAGAPLSATTAADSSGAGDFNGVSLGTPSASGASSFTTLVNTGGHTSVLTDTGIQASSTIGSGLIMEDLWFNTKGGAWVDKGVLTFDTTGASPSLTFTPTAVPEPSTYGLFGGAGVLALAVRRQFRRKTA